MLVIPLIDDLEVAYYELALENSILKKGGDEFQDFFSLLMELSHPGDFIRTRPWGNVGDRKNDGYLKSQRILFQVYAPNELSAAKAIAKIEEDFLEGLPHWDVHFVEWTFTHNSISGLGPEVLSTLLTLETNHKKKITHFGPAEIRPKVFKLSRPDIAKLLGPAPSRQSLSSVSFEALRPILIGISRSPTSADVDVRPVPEDKITYNKLSPSVAVLLKAGMSKSTRVGEFFARWPDPTLGDSIAAEFSKKYAQLKSIGLTPDEIFTELHRFAGGGERGSPEHEAAVLAVLAHFFEECDIFERPTTGGGS